MHKESDEYIVQMILKGKTDLYYHLVKRYEKKLEAYVMRLINRREEVDDIVQNVFIKAYKNLRVFDSSLKFSSWIYRIAHNETINTMSSSFIQKMVAVSDMFSFGRSDETEERLYGEELRHNLKKCIDNLHIKYREPLVLFIYEEKTYEDISDILRIPVRAVGVLIHRAKLQVEKLCNEKKHS